jgi:hypothetical protein
MPAFPSSGESEVTWYDNRPDPSGRSFATALSMMTPADPLGSSAQMGSGLVD